MLLGLVHLYQCMYRYQTCKKSRNLRGCILGMFKRSLEQLILNLPLLEVFYERLHCHHLIPSKALNVGYFWEFNANYAQKVYLFTIEVCEVLT